MTRGSTNQKAVDRVASKHPNSPWAKRFAQAAKAHEERDAQAQAQAAQDKRLEVAPIQDREGTNSSSQMNENSGQSS